MRVPQFLLAVLAPFAASACGEVIPLEIAALEGSWRYSASFSVVSDTANAVVHQCEIAGLDIALERPTEVGYGTYEFDTQTSGGRLACTGDGTEDFVHDLAATSVYAAIAFFSSLNLEIPTPLGELLLEGTAPYWPETSHAGDDDSHWTGVSPDSLSGHLWVGPPSRQSVLGMGHFKALRR